MDQDIQKKLDEQGVKIDAIYKSVEKTRKYFLTMLWISLIVVVLPIIGLIFALPAFLNNYVGNLSDLSNLGI